MSDTKPKFSEGQTLYRIHSIKGWDDAEAVVVGKLGRKWAPIRFKAPHRRDDVKVDIRTGECTIGPRFRSWGYCFVSKEDWEAEIARRAILKRNHIAWEALQKELRYKYSKPDGITAEQIIEAAQMLGIALVVP